MIGEDEKLMLVGRLHSLYELMREPLTGRRHDAFAMTFTTFLRYMNDANFGEAHRHFISCVAGFITTDEIEQEYFILADELRRLRGR